MSRKVIHGALLSLVALALASGAAGRQHDSAQYDASGHQIGLPLEFVECKNPNNNLTIPPPAPGCQDAELQMLATATQSGGGSGGFGPATANNGVYSTSSGAVNNCCSSASCWAWISAGIYPTAAWYRLVWPSFVDVCQIWVDTKPIAAECGAGSNRGLHASDIETSTDGGLTWTFQGSVTNQSDDWGFVMPGGCKTVNALRLNRLGVVSSVSQASNPIMYELKVYGCAPVTGCRSPSLTGITPTAGATPAGATTCSRSQAFTAGLSQADPGNVTFSITPPVGGTATPATNTVAYASNATSVSSTHTLSRPGLCGTATFNVAAAAAASCAPATISNLSINYVLSDGTQPVVTPPPTAQVECGTGAPPPSQTGNATVTDNCDPAPVILGFSDATQPAPPPVPACPGNYNILRTFNGRDCNANTASATQTIQVRDTTPPTLSAQFLPAAPLPPQSPHSVCSAAPSVRRFTVGGTASDTCDPTPAVTSIMRVTNHDVTPTGTCTQRIDDVVVGVNELVELRILAPPCPARSPRSAVQAVSVNSLGVKVISGEKITVVVSATDACNNSAEQSFDPTVEPSPLCDEQLPNGTCCPPLRAPRDPKCKVNLCGR